MRTLLFISLLTSLLYSQIDSMKILSNNWYLTQYAGGITGQTFPYTEEKVIRIYCRNLGDYELEYYIRLNDSVIIEQSWGKKDSTLPKLLSDATDPNMASDCHIVSLTEDEFFVSDGISDGYVYYYKPVIGGMTNTKYQSISGKWDWIKSFSPFGGQIDPDHKRSLIIALTNPDPLNPQISYSLFVEDTLAESGSGIEGLILAGLAVPFSNTGKVTSVDSTELLISNLMVDGYTNHYKKDMSVGKIVSASIRTNVSKFKWNITHGKIVLMCENSSQPLTLALYDLKGRLLKQVTGLSKPSITIASYPNGFYIYRVTDANQELAVGFFQKM